MKNLVVAQIEGGLGNQLFQFGAAKSQQADPTDPVILDDRHDFQWAVQLSQVLKPNSIRRASSLELLRLRQIPRTPRFRRSLSRYQDQSSLGFLKRWVVDDSLVDLRHQPKVLLRGYFQDEAWLIPGAAAIVASFRPPSSAVSIALDSFARQGQVTVGISVRSGIDYQSFGVCLERAYYVKAAQLLAAENVVFVIVGDVQGHCEEVGRAIAPFAKTWLGTEFGPGDQLNLLAGCQHAVISNSSFAWWGAWLGDQRQAGEQRVVIRPKPWIASANTTCPERWQAVTASQGASWG